MGREWKKAPASFQTDLARGRIGELSFLHATNGSLKPTDGREGDFIVASSGEKVELKTDYYDHAKTQNFFIERYRSGFKPGGVWQAEEHGAKYFVYCFSNPGVFYVFETVKLAQFLEHLIAAKLITLVDVPNKGYTTRGYKVPRVMLEELYMKFEDIGVDFSLRKFQNFRDYNKASA